MRLKSVANYSLFILFSCFFTISCISDEENKQINNLSVEEIESGWTLLFDGKTTDGWHSFQKEDVQGWIVEEGALIGLGKGSDLGGDIVTDQDYENFELSLEWKISEGGNSGILYHVLEEDYSATYVTGPEYQLIDNIGFPQKLEDWQMAAANYAMHPAENVLLKPIGEYNTSRILVFETHVEHWLNGVKVVEFERWTNDWKEKVQNCKWKDYPAYGLAKSGKISLQDHGDKIWFRNIKIRELNNDPKSIFNGKDLSGWKIYGTEKWYVKDEELICESGVDKKYGYLATEQQYKNFILDIDFKQEANGNSGIFFRSTIEGTKITGWQVEVAPPGFDSGGIYESYGRGWLKQIPEDMEGHLIANEWNHMKILVINDQVITWLNGVEMVHLKDAKIGQANGSIALQIHDGGGIKVRWKNLLLQEIILK